ncbi:MAG: peptidoglycan-binding domain-containing protein [Pseudomonadota bacterium]
MKPIHALAILGALAAGPALAQEYPSGPVGQQQGQAAGRPEAVIMGVEIPEQAVQPQFMAQIQQQLQSQGLYDGPIDGLYGDRTQAALAAWQRQQGLQPTGQLNAQTLAAMDVGSMATQQAAMPEEQLRTQQQQPGMQQQQQQQARQPGADEDALNVETLREEHMSSPNIEGEAVPERPGTGVPAPGRSPESLEQPPRD